MIVDRYLPLGEKYHYIVQEFERNTLEKLEELGSQFKKYNEVVLIYDDEQDHPKGIMTGFARFLEKNNINGKVVSKYSLNHLKKNVAYITINDSALWHLLKDCQNQNYKVGKDIGVVGHNEDILKEMMFDGITTISTDFRQMASESAEYVNLRKPTQRTIDTKLYLRNSL